MRIEKENQQKKRILRSDEQTIIVGVVARQLNSHNEVLKERIDNTRLILK